MCGCCGYLTTNYELKLCAGAHNTCAWNCLHNWNETETKQFWNCFVSVSFVLILCMHASMLNSYAFPSTGMTIIIGIKRCLVTGESEWAARVAMQSFFVFNACSECPTIVSNKLHRAHLQMLKFGLPFSSLSANFRSTIFRAPVTAIDCLISMLKHSKRAW